MDSPLNQSRFSKNSSEIFRSTGASLVFKTVGRNTKPSWSNRINKDVNDLHYNLDINLFGKNRFHSVTLSPNKFKNSSMDKQHKINFKQKRKSFFAQQLDKIFKSTRSFTLKKLKDENQEQIKNKKIANLSTIQTYGLSTYEYKNTITGKMQTKPNIHLKFDKKPQRKMDTKISWYNPELEINVGKMDEKKYRKMLQKYHPFESYTERKIFQTKQKVDKIYETQAGKRKTSPSRIKRTVPLDTVPGRKPSIIKQSSYLSYEITGGEQAIKRSPPKYSIKNTPKNLIFSRQVINNKRGCYR